MKTTLAIAFLATLALCGNAFAQAKSDESVPSASYTRYSTGTPDYSDPKSPYRSWTTAALQQRRIELYQTVPRNETRNGVPVYHYSAGPLPQQDKIFAIESELNRRFKAGDKAAALDRPIPGAQHPH